MKKLLLYFSMALLLFFISGCGGGYYDGMPCSEYCSQQLRPECIGEWQASGEYPGCTCDFKCTEEQNASGEEQPAETTPSCTNECEAIECLENKQYECITGTDGCKNKVESKIAKGKCGVECISNSDCTGQECIAYKCKAKVGSWDLGNLPAPFLSDAIFVVGANAPAMDVASSVQISSMLIYKSGKTFESKLDNQITEADYSHNLIIIGNPCDNTMVKTVFGIECDGTNLNDNQAIIKLADSRGKAALLVSGKTTLGTSEAAKRVANYETSGLSGSEMIINIA
ncbi:MAG: hypothetical protein WC852_02885 [Candidatus Nanoarchaeia archaeon]|jgi:hypothetical protein